MHKSRAIDRDFELDHICLAVGGGVTLGLIVVSDLAEAGNRDIGIS
jgi:hypothetical protein